MNRRESKPNAVELTRIPSTYAVTPAKAGVQERLKGLDSGLRRNDEAVASSKARIPHQQDGAYFNSIGAETRVYSKRAPAGLDLLPISISR